VNGEKFALRFQKESAHVPTFLSLFGIDGSPRTLDVLFDRISSWVRKDRTDEGGSGRNRRLVLDSLTDLTARFPMESVVRFLTELCEVLKNNQCPSIFTVVGRNTSSASVETLGSLLDGIIQMKIDDESGDQLKRSVRLYSHKTLRAPSKWIEFCITSDANLEFINNTSSPSASETMVCKLCEGPIMGSVTSSEASLFHPNCLDTYRKLSAIYGSHTLYALEPGVVDANFFFVDIVGLSDPQLSVEKQIGKIGQLNSLIRSCDAYSKVPKDKKIVLPTGDGMAIGFLLNPELPLLLSMQVHGKLKALNAEIRTPSDHLSIRIGLSSGPVFVVSDVNDNQNVWGPGIILARRVMDTGDNGHILLADNIAEPLINLKDIYRRVIHLVKSDFKIKHDQSLRLYSAYSNDFGNSNIPSKL
jgi:hypothetical protein